MKLSSTSSRDGAGSSAEQPLIHLREHIGVLIGGAPEHDAIDMRQMLARLAERPDAAIDDDGEVRPPRLHAIHPVIVDRRHVAVLFRAQAFEPGLARMHDEGAAAALRPPLDEAVEALLRILVVDADAAFDRDRHLGAFAHRRDQVGDKLGLGHQAGAEPPRLHPVRRAADIEIDLVIAELGADARGLGECCRIAAADLQRDRMLGRMELEQPFRSPCSTASAVTISV